MRDLELVCGIELEGIAGKPTARAFDVRLKCFWEKGMLIRPAGDIIAPSPALIIERQQINQLFGSIAEVLKTQQSAPQGPAQPA